MEMEHAASSSLSGVARTELQFVRIEALVRSVWPPAESDSLWPKAKKVTFEYFRDVIWPALRSRAVSSLEPLVVWTQIQSHLKGSIESLLQPGAFSIQDYADLSKFNMSRCRMEVEARKEIFHFFTRYDVYLKENGMWDSSDIVRAAFDRLRRLAAEDADGRWRYDRVYVDEVQDMTQAEIAVLIQLVGQNKDGIFFAGDTAQSITQGVDFRFEEVRSCMHALTEGRQRLDKVDRLTRSLRTHEGILKTANAILQLLYRAFPRGIDQIQADEGLCVGPAPGYCTHATFASLKQLCQKHPKLQLLTWDSYVPKLVEYIDSPSEMVFGFRQIKGLEFSEVAIVDFFHSGGATSSLGPAEVSPGLQKQWKTLLASAVVSGAGDKEPQQSAAVAGSFPAELEVQLKVLYTTVTRSCSRLLFIETGPSTAGDAWMKFLQTNHLARPYKLAPVSSSEASSGVESAVAAREADSADSDQLSTVMLMDDYKCQGLAFAAASEDTEDIGERLSLLRKARVSFQLADDALLVQKVSCCIRGFEQLQRHDSERDRSAPAAVLEELISSSVQHLLEGGAIDEASELVRSWCHQPRLQKLSNRVDRLRKQLNKVA